MRLRRRVPKFSRRNRFRRFFARTPGVRRTRRGRIYRRFVRRVALRPELKYIDTLYNIKIGNSLATPAPTAINASTWGLTPSVILQGTSNDQRIGNQLKFTKVDLRMILRDDSNSLITTANQTVLRTSYLIRIMVWTPRNQFVNDELHMTNVQIDGHWNPSAATVLWDKVVMLAPNFVDADPVALDTAMLPNGGSRSVMFLHHTFAFPRNVKFMAGSDGIIDPDKEMLYITVRVQNQGGVAISAFTEARTFYFDS